MTLGRRYGSETVKIRDIALDSDLPEKFLELILLELKNARIVESIRGAKGGYQSRHRYSLLGLAERLDLIEDIFHNQAHKTRCRSSARRLAKSCAEAKTSTCGSAACMPRVSG